MLYEYSVMIKTLQLPQRFCLQPTPCFTLLQVFYSYWRVVCGPLQALWPWQLLGHGNVFGFLFMLLAALSFSIL